MEKRRRSGNNNTVSTEELDSLLNGGNGLLVVGLPDVTSVNNTGREDLAGGKGTGNGLELLRVANKVNVDSGDRLDVVEDLNVVDNVTEVGGEGDLGDGITLGGEEIVGGLESSLSLLGKVENEDGLIDLDSLGTGSLELFQQLNIDGKELVEEGDGKNRLATVWLSEVKERDGSDKDRAGGDAQGLGLVELTDGLGVSSKAEGLVVLEGRTDVVVV